MEAGLIFSIVAAAWTVLQPFLRVIAMKGAEEIGKVSISEVWKFIKRKFDSKTETRQVLINLLKDPEDADVQSAFRFHLKRYLQEDQVFTTNLIELLRATGSLVLYEGKIEDSGALAHGTGATAVGRGGVLIGGDAKNNIIITGNKSKLKSKK
jgi:hypothetical protein